MDSNRIKEEILRMNNKIYLPTSASFLVTEDCNLRCTYCVTGNTLITMSDFSKKAIKDIEIGDEILGFDEYVKGKGKHRLVKPTKVLQLFNRRDKVIKITLENGNEIEITKNHKILNNRGSSEFSWKEAGKYKVGQNIRVLPQVEPIYPNVEDINYKVGYFVAMLLGDGNVGRYKDRLGYDAFRVRIAVKDLEIIKRMEDYFNFFGIKYNVGMYEISKKHNLKSKYLYAHSKESFFKTIKIIEENFCKNKSLSYYQGFLAGIYDAEGSIEKSKNIIRITNSDLDILGEIEDGLKLLQIDYTLEKKNEKVNKQCYIIRVNSPRSSLENLKFILSVQNVVARKGVENFYSKSLLNTSKIVSIEEIPEEVEVFNIGTESRTYVSNNIAVHNCFEKHKPNHMTREVARKGLEYLSDNAIKNGDNNFSAMLFGGEPLLKPKIVEEILRYGLELGKRKGLHFSASMVTNATQLTDDIKRIIRTYKDSTNLNIQLSVDGIKEVHDKYRVTRDGSPTFDSIEEKIPQWLELFKDNPQALSIHGCSNHDTLPFLFENFLFFREEWGFERIWFMPIHSEEWYEEDIAIYDEQLTKIADYVIARAKKEGNIKEIQNYAPIDKCLNPDVRPDAPCGAGKNFVTITAKGDLYPCHQFYFNDPEHATKIGDIWEGIDEPKRSIFVNYSNEDLSCSKEMPNCDCFGCYRCIAENWGQNGSILSVVRGVRCKMSFVERKIQLRMRKEIENMGLMNNNQNNNNSDCLCDSRGHINGCDVVSNCDGNTIPVGSPSNNKESCGCGDSKCDSGSDNDTIAMALKLILDKVDTIEKEQAIILKKLL